MSEPVNMDVSLVQEESQTGKSSSPKQTTSELDHEIGSQITPSELLEQENEIVSEKVQNEPLDARAAKPNCIGVERLEPTLEDSIKNSSCEQLESPTEGATMRSGLEQCVSPPEDDADKSSTPTQTILEYNHEVGSGSVFREQLEQKEESGTENVQNRLAEIDYVGYERSGQPPEDMTQNSCCERPNLSPAHVTMKSPLEQSVSPSEDVALNSNPGLEKLGPQVADEAKNPRWLGRGVKRTNARKGNFDSKSSVECTRVLRSRSQEKSKVPEPINILAEHGPNEEKKRKKRCERVPVNEFSKIRNHLRYLLHRMSYEKNLIDAYSGDGWKGLSLEKVKLEKELQRAKSEIFRCKLKIRGLLQRLDLICAEGKLPEALFDSEGQIDSEDIFCAKCRSDDLRADNDIILCDGACERGFHQFCLEPPLLKEHIPPDDEGWLCPGCDCKVDCISLLNESQGMNLSITDSWEKVFPEAAAGSKLDDDIGFPSDDSEDDNYDPNSLEDDEKVQGDETSSDESDLFSASDDLRASPNNEQYLSLPSDDSEDDDYNPDAPDLNEQDKQKSTSSDFTSDSEDFGNITSAEKEGHMSLLSDHVRFSEKSDPVLGDSASGKRHVERLDYKKLHDETYGNVSSDSSDEGWKDTNAQKSTNGKAVSVSPNDKTQNTKDMRHSPKDSENTPKRGARKKLDVEGTNSSPAKSCKASSEPGYSDKSNTKSAYKKLGEAVSQGLFKSFQENQYPPRDTKENLAKELGITLQQVSKWFENARISFRHSSRTESDKAESGQNESRSQKSTTPKSRKRKGKSDQAIAHSPSTAVTPTQSAKVKSPEAKNSGRARKSRRKSVA